MKSTVKKTAKSFETSNTTPKSYCFGEYIFDSEKLELRKSGEAIALKMQPARLLKLLLESAPETLTRRILQEKIWDNGTTIEFEQGLNVCVNQLRMALGDTASNPTYIATQPKRGYRFIAPIEVEYKAFARRNYGLIALLITVVTLVFGGVWYANSGTQLVAQPRIYVSPIEFVDAGSDTHSSLIQYGLRLGIVDQLIRSTGNDILTLNGETLWADEQLLRLDRISDYRLVIKVTSDTDKLRANAMLLREGEDDARDEQSFDIGALDADNLAKVALEITRWVASSLGSSLTSNESISFNQDPGYFEAIINAKRTFKAGNGAALEESLKWSHQALAISPSSTEAKGIIALALIMLVGGDEYPVDETYARALRYADEIRSAIGATVESELVRGSIAMYRDLDLEKAEEAFDLALEIAPGDALLHVSRAELLGAKGDAAGAAREADIAVMLDPSSTLIISDRCWYLRAAHRNKEAVTACIWAQDFRPEDNKVAENNMVAIQLALSLEAVGREADAVKIIDELLTKIGAEQGVEAIPDGYFVDDTMPALQMRFCEAAWRALPGNEGFRFSLYYAAVLWAKCGEYERTVTALRKLKSMRHPMALFYQIDPTFDAFRTSTQASAIDMEISVRETK